jgi:transcription factor E2F7/8
LQCDLLLAQLETISLDEAARLLLGERHAESNMRSQYLHFFYFYDLLLSWHNEFTYTSGIHNDSDVRNAAKVRRLYDIANVLSSLNLIEKVVSSPHAILDEWKWSFFS